MSLATLKAWIGCGGRHAAAGAALIGAAALLAGCMGGGPGKDVALNQAAGRPTGPVGVWAWSISAKALQQLAPVFQKDDPGTRVDVAMTGATIKTRLMLSLASGVGAPDISQMEYFDAPKYIATHRLTDLTPVAGKYKSLFPASCWAECTMNNRVYAIPWDFGPCNVFYKRDLFAKYGIDPSSIHTWDDYIAAGQKIYKASGGKTKLLPLNEADIAILFEMLLQQTHGEVFDAQGRIAINSPQCQLALDQIKKLRQSGVCADVSAYSQEWMAGFTDDSIASYPGAFWLGGIIKDDEKDYPGAKPSWGVFRLPAVVPGGPQTATLGGSVLVIPASSTNKQAAWAFVNYALCSMQGTVNQYKDFGLFPAYAPALKSQVMDQPDPFYGGQAVGRFFSQGSMTIWPLNRTPNWNEAITDIKQNLSSWAANGMPDDGVLAKTAIDLHKRLNVPIAPQPASVLQTASMSVAAPDAPGSGKKA